MRALYTYIPDDFSIGRSNADGDWIQLCHLETSYGIAADAKDTVFTLQ